jgi:hypothetical protein
VDRLISDLREGTGKAAFTGPVEDRNATDGEGGWSLRGQEREEYRGKRE